METRRLLRASVAILAAALMAPGPLAAVEPSALTLEVSSSAPAYTDTVVLTATSSPSRAGLSVWFVNASDDHTIGSATISEAGIATFSRAASLYGLGSHTVYAVSGGPSAPVTFVVQRASTSLSMTWYSFVQANHSVWVKSIVRQVAAFYSTAGDVSFYLDGSLAATCTTPLAGWGPLDGPWGAFAWCEIPPMAAGDHVLRAAFSGTAELLPISLTSTISVVPDTVDVSNPSVQYSTFYPVTDGYRDTDAIVGERIESVSVGIRIYNSYGTLVRSAAIAAGTGLYSYRWNGRNSSGYVLAEGRYRVVQRLVDTAGTVRSVTSYVTLSRKRLYYHTAYLDRSALTTYGTMFSAEATVTRSVANGYVKIIPRTGWALIGWSFTLPSAVVYKSIAFRVYLRHQRTTGDATGIAAEDFSRAGCWSGTSFGGWSRECFAPWRQVGNSTGAAAWFTTGSLPSVDRDGATVHAAFYTANTSNATYLYKGQVVVTYGVLGY